MARNTFKIKDVTTEFVVKNISPTRKNIRLFGLNLGWGRSYDLLQLPYISESDIRHSLLKGDLKYKSEASEIRVLRCSIDLTQYDIAQRAFLESIGVTHCIETVGYDLSINGQEQGSIIYFDGSNWVNLPPSDDGYILTTHGSGDNPTWEDTSDFLTSSDLIVWDDLRVPITSVETSGIRDPSFEIFDNGLRTYAFTYQANQLNEEEVFFIAQLPHSYREGTNIYPHVHWSPSTTDTNTVRWGFEYSWSNVSDVYPSSTTIYSDVDTGGVAKKMLIGSFGELDGTGKKISSILVCRLFRNSSHLNDTYTENAFIFEFDFHFQSDSFGSSQQYIK